MTTGPVAVTTKTEKHRDEPFAWCCASFDVATCDCANKDHGTASRNEALPKPAPKPSCATPPEKHRHTAEVEALNYEAMWKELYADLSRAGIRSMTHLMEAITARQPALATQPTPTTAEDNNA